MRRLDGSRARIRRYERSASAARAAATEAAREEATRRAGGGRREVLSDSSSVAALAEAYIASLEGERAAHTLMQYRSVQRKHIRPRLGEISVGECTTALLDDVAVSVGDGTWRTIRAILSGAWRWGSSRGITATSPVPATKTAAPSRPDSVTVVTPAELRALLARFEELRDGGNRGTRKPWLGPLLLVMLATGARISEVMRMRWEDISGLDDDGPVVIGIRGAKTRTRRAAGASRVEGDDLPVTRSVTLAPFAVEALLEQRETLGDLAGLTRWVWPTAAGETHLNRSAVQQGLQDVYGYAPPGQKPKPLPGLRVTPHVLRHTSGTWIGHDSTRGRYERDRALGHSPSDVGGIHYDGSETVDIAELMQNRWDRKE
ncbi:tyrosine-type recombinase/integrase [Corynebacterium sp. AOP12-C2-36]|uniref:tyrosine-type recombinase/integrase n=1 Tax=Corynebacterium sp. AOP12-C2-36 TaxID=3457723 RepID=UPI004034756A